MNSKINRLFLLLALMIPFVLVACGGAEEPAEVDEPAAEVEVVEEPEVAEEEAMDEEMADDEAMDEEMADDEAMDEEMAEDEAMDEEMAEEDHSDDEMMEEMGTIAEVATEAGSFNTLLAALDAAGLAGTFADADAGPFTVFAPTDDAFAALPEGTVEALLEDPSGALTDILTYHVVEGEVLAETVVTLDSATTLGGADVAIAVVDGGVVLNDSVNVVTTDIKTSNGVIHVIDGVLLPPADDMMDEGDDMMDAGFMMSEADCEAATDGPFAGVSIQDVTFEWWHNHRGSREENLIPLLERFNAENPCNVTLVPSNQGGYGDIRDKVNANIASGGELPAMVVGYQNDQAFYQLNETLVDLDLFMNDAKWGMSDSERDDFFASFVEQGVQPAFGNTRLGFPPNRSMEMMFINETFMNDLGYDTAPTTPDEFREIACAGAENNGDGTGGYVLRDDASGVAAWTLAFGGDIVNDAGEYQYNNSATVEAMAFLRGMFEDGCAFFFDGFPNPEVAARRAVFAQGSSSGIPFYVGDFATVAEENGTDPDVVAVTAIPHTTAEPVQNVYGADVMIVSSTPQEELAAWYFLKWFTSPEIQAEWVQISNYFPTRRATSEFLGDYEAENEVWATAAELLPFGRYEPQAISYDQVRRSAQEAFNAIMQGGDIESILGDLDEFGNELQEELMAEIEG